MGAFSKMDASATMTVDYHVLYTTYNGYISSPLIRVNFIRWIIDDKFSLQSFSSTSFVYACLIIKGRY
jgi:hypothetical protein